MAEDNIENGIQIPVLDPHPVEAPPVDKRLANLRPPWKAGESGNPKGRPEGSRNRQSVVREMLEAAAPEAIRGFNKLGISGETVFEQMVAAQICRAVVLGDTAAFKEMADSAYGKITDKTELTGKDGEKLEGINVQFVPPPK